MAGILTKTGLAKIAQKQASGEPLIIENFIFAYIEGLDPNQDPSENEPIPPADKIQYTAPITRAGYVSPAEVVYSIIIGSDIGDWSFNWIGLQDEDGELFAVIYIPTQQKIKNIPPSQIGNMITRNFLVGYNAIADVTQITIPAESWQFDITDVLNHIEDNNRLSLRAIFGRAFFFQDGFKVIKNADNYSLNGGVAFIEGLRLYAENSIPLTIDTNKKIWLDVFKNKVNGKSETVYLVAYGDNLTDYIDDAGRQHYIINIATINDQQLTDHRKKLVHQSIMDAVSNDPNSDPLDLASIAALQKLKEDLITNNNDISGNTTLTKEQRGIININANTADTIITLPPANADNKGIEYTLRRTDNTSNILSVNASGNDKIMFHLNLSPNGFGHFELFGIGDYWSIYCDGAGKWYVTGRYDTSPIGIVTPSMSMTLPSGGYFPTNRQAFDMARFEWLTIYAASSDMVVDITEADQEENAGKWVIDSANNQLLSPLHGGDFIRALDMGRGVDPVRVAGSWQRGSIMAGDYTVAGTTSAGIMNNVDNSSANFWKNAGYDKFDDTVYGSTIVGVSVVANYTLDNQGLAVSRPRNIAYPFIFKAI